LERTELRLENSQQERSLCLARRRAQSLGIACKGFAGGGRGRGHVAPLEGPSCNLEMRAHTLARSDRKRRGGRPPSRPSGIGRAGPRRFVASSTIGRKPLSLGLRAVKGHILLGSCHLELADPKRVIGCRQGSALV